LNLIDKFVEIVNPKAAMERTAARKVMEVMNSGYSEGGASYSKKSMRGWTANSASPSEDIDLNLPTLRNRARDLYMNAPLATSSLKTTRTNVVGAGLRLKARIDNDFLGISQEQADEWERQTEREFELWSDSKHCDALKMNNFSEQQQIAFLGMLMNGDSFGLLKTGKVTPYMPYALRIHLIEADRVNTPNSYGALIGGSRLSIEAKNPTTGNEIISGVEIDKDGAVVAYHISSKYPQSTSLNLEVTNWTRVEAFGKITGRPNVLHLMECERAEQRRGVPFLAPVIETLKQLTRYTEAELMASVIAGMFTVFIKTQGPTTENPLGSMIPQEQQVASDEPANYEMGNGAINILGQGESVDIANPARPNTAFDGFINALARYIGAALEIPQELLQKSFNSSYSASRAALLEAWKMFRMRRTWMAKDFCQPIYEEFLAEAVARGRIKAPGFWQDPLIRKAWCGAEWNGPAPGQVDPLKEVNAAVIRVNNAFSTRERETMELTGGDFDRNVKQVKRESELMKGVNEEDGKDTD
jgi:lambda family phage portal protein